MIKRPMIRGRAILAIQGKILAFCSVVLVLGLIGLGPAFAESDANDPLEPVNRVMLDFNLTLDRYLVKPVAVGYRAVTPAFFRTGVANFLTNLRSPVVLVNDLMQGEFDRAAQTAGRFAVNTTVGIGGVRDVSKEFGLPEKHDEDFGQTLAVHGVGAGPYLVLPLLGPTNPRDVVGRVVDFAISPFSSPALTGVNAVVARERDLGTIEDLQRSSIDLYAAIRSATRQLRTKEIRNGAPAEADLFDVGNDLSFDDPALD